MGIYLNNQFQIQLKTHALEFQAQEILSEQYLNGEKNIEYSCLYINKGGGTFRDIAKNANLNRSI